MTSACSIASTIKNPRHFDANRPFGAAPMTRQPTRHTDPSTIEICDDPIPGSRASCGNKYEAIFSNLKIGQALKCQPIEVNRMSNGLRKWIQDKGIQGAVRSMKDYGDGKGRVWLLAVAEPKAALKSVKG